LELLAYQPLLLRSTLASRLGAGLAWGDFPMHESVFLGGRRSLRGYKSERFAGDGALFGSCGAARSSVCVTLLTRGQLGALAFADAGRVYLDGRSPGPWHTAWGGGLWYRTLGVSGALSYVLGEERRLHACFGLPF
jgi:outer membrane translocation and assembly module TamA